MSAWKEFRIHKEEFQHLALEGVSARTSKHRIFQGRFMVFKEFYGSEGVWVSFFFSYNLFRMEFWWNFS